jgi:hypothetical protein
MNTKPVLLAFALFAAPAVHAGQTCYTAQFSSAPTNWQQTASVPQFDPAQGALSGITVSFQAHVGGSVGIESLDNRPSQASSVYASDMQLADYGGSVLLSLTPSVGFLDSLAPFDGTIDFGGTSGVFHGNISVEDSGSISVPLTPENLAAYVGLGTVSFDAAAVGASMVTGPGNIVSQILTSADATVTICYEFFQDCDGDGISDEDEIAAGEPDLYGPGRCSPDGIPDVCQPQDDCDGDGSPDVCEADSDGNGIPDDCEAGEGCTPGYWKNHLSAWAVTGYSPDQDFDTVFGVNAFRRDLTLEEALNQGGGGIKALGRHAVAALLNSAHPGVAYPLTSADVITLVQNAVATGDYETTKDLLAGYNEAGCPL